MARRRRREHQTLPRCVCSAVLAVLAALAIGWLSPLSVAAHSFLLLSTPGEGQRLAEPPSSVQLLYSEPVAPVGDGVVVMNDATMESVAQTPARMSSSGTALSVSLPPLAPGGYTVSWSVVSRNDGHMTTGTVSFTVGQDASSPVAAQPRPATGAALPPQQDASPRDWVGMAASWMLLAGLAAAAGGLAGEHVLAGRRRAEPAWRLSGAYLSAGMAVALAGCTLAFVITAGRIADGSALHGLDIRTWLPALQVRAAFEDACMAGLVANALLTMLLVRDRVVPLVSLTAAAVLVGMRTHPASASVSVEVVMAVHVAIALLWSGALAYLVVLLGRRRRLAHPPDLGGALRRYARFALLSVLAIVVTGSAAAVAELAPRGALLSTAYGRLLVVKLILVAAVLLTATAGRAVSMGRGLPRVRTLRTLVRTEVAGVLLVLLTTAALANVPPPAPSPAVTSVAQSAP